MSSGKHQSSAKAILYALLANFGIAVAKGGAAFYTGSGSMLAEAIHSLADCGNQGLLFLGLHQSKTKPTLHHPLGFGKAIYFWSFVVSIILFSMGGLFSIYEGVHKIESNEPLNDAWIALLVLGASIVMEAFSFMGAIREINKLRKDKPLFTWLKESRNAELVVVFGEDLAALLGLAIAFGFVVIASVTGNLIFDALGSIAIGCLLVIISFFLSAKVKSLLIGQSADPEVEAKIQAILLESTGIKEVFRIITLQMGPDVMLSAKVRLDSSLTLEEGIGSINHAEVKIKEAYPEVRWSFIEPDIAD